MAARSTDAKSSKEKNTKKAAEAQKSKSFTAKKQSELYLNTFSNWGGYL